MSDSVNGKRVLVTGAGGWLGGEIASRLAASGAKVTAFMRRPGVALGNDGMAVPARVVLGDIALPRLGWDAATWRAEAGGHDLLVHCAALTRFDADPAQAQAVNLGGTEAMVALARAGGAGLLHVSTAYVNSEGGVIEEGTAPRGPFTNAYEASKAAAEHAVREADIPAVIARPSIILGEWGTGRVRRFGTFYYLLKAFAEGRVTRMPAAADATLDMVPIDHVASGLMALAARFDAAAGGTFHLVSGAPTPMGAFPDTLSRFGLAAPEFVAPGPFAAEGRMFARLIAPYVPYFRRNPRFDDAGFRRLTGLACPPVGPAWWGRLVSFAVKSGFIAQASRGGAKGMASESATPSSAGSR